MKNIHKTGGNYFDDMRIDIDAAFEFLPETNIAINRSCVIVNFTRRIRDFLLIKTNYMEVLVLTGIRRAWFKEFRAFWSKVLEGRPINIMDFHMLRMMYRVRNQKITQLNWDTIEQHMDNWKNDENMGMLFSQIYNSALTPYKPLPYVRRKDRVLEYGCSHAPYYRSYREYYGHKNARWVLADIKNISFLYAKYSYAKDLAIEKMVVIDENNADNPLEDLQGEFDVIILTTVLEHLHKPRVIVEMLLSRLRQGGYFIFDYIKSEAQGLDTTQGLEQRLETLQYIKENVSIIKGNLDNINESVSLCIAKRR